MFDALVSHLKLIHYLDFRNFYRPFLTEVGRRDVYLFIAISGYFFYLHRKSSSQRQPRNILKAWFNFTFTREDLKKKSFALDVQWYILNTLSIVTGISSIAFFFLCIKHIPELISRMHFYNSWLGIALRAPIGTLSASNQRWVFFGLAFILADFFQYLGHWMQHNFEFLWAFHKVHHYPTQLNYIGIYRAHPFDVLMNQNLPPICVTFLLSFIFPLKSGFLRPEDFIDVHGTLFWMLFALPQFFNGFGHTKFPVNYGKFFNSIFNSPLAHQVHHSAEIKNVNLGGSFLIWDRLFKTFYMPETLEERAQITGSLGVHGIPDDHYKNVVSAIVFPILDSLGILLKGIYVPFRNFWLALSPALPKLKWKQP